MESKNYQFAALSEDEDYQEKLHLLEELFDSRKQNFQLKNELKMARKCLQREVGDDVNIAELLCGASNWRGRAEQISMLQGELKKLKEGRGSDVECSESSRMPSKIFELNQRIKFEVMSELLEECKAELEDAKQKMIALEDQNRILLQKSKHDDDRINSMIKQLQQATTEDRNKKSSDDFDQYKQQVECGHKIGVVEEEIQKADLRQESLQQEVKDDVDNQGPGSSNPSNHAGWSQQKNTDDLEEQSDSDIECNQVYFRSVYQQAADYMNRAMYEAKRK